MEHFFIGDIIRSIDFDAENIDLFGKA